LPWTSVTKQAATPPSPADGIISSSEFGIINPARAQLLISAPDRFDPDRHLYEPRAEPPARNLSTKVDNVNNLPLGLRRTDRPSEELNYADPPKKRKHEVDTQMFAAKRPRLDIGRASVLVQGTLAASGTEDSTNVFHPYPKPSLSRSMADYSHKSDKPLRSTETHEQNHKQHVDSVQDQVSKLVKSRGELETFNTTLDRVDRSSIESLLGRVDRIQRQAVKTETTSDDPRAICTKVVPTTRPDTEAAARVLIGGCSIALWVGVSNIGSFNSENLIKDDQIPYALAIFLFTEMKKYMNDANAKVWNDMTPNRDTCVLQYLIDGHRLSGLPQERRACRACSSTWVGHHRPCALLQEIDGVRTLVFMPLRDALRRGIAWTEERYWLLDI
jgi:hypothetical protein